MKEGDGVNKSAVGDLTEVSLPVGGNKETQNINGVAELVEVPRNVLGNDDLNRAGRDSLKKGHNNIQIPSNLEGKENVQELDDPAEGTNIADHGGTKYGRETGNCTGETTSKADKGKSSAACGDPSRLKRREILSFGRNRTVGPEGA
ncbi:hypothetical protein L6452_31014 [Arctium lappa]|uniref:Uncharacterized protein n=1 Tax=Arctium lappa TaxID=4217 RepID=A0ACB8ZJK5_ARCLA|nr:hypothetical protein L6452_31014 [Arctium lappa]